MLTIKKQKKTLQVMGVVLFAISTLLLLLYNMSSHANSDLDEGEKNSPLSRLNQNKVSYDGFSEFDENNQTIFGDGTGDVLLLILDETSKGPRKRSLMIDLSFTNEDMSQNDFTVIDALSLKHKLYYTNTELTRFIKKAKSPKDLKWSIYGVANHTFSKFGDMNSLKIINSGILTSQPDISERPISYSDIHNIQAMLSTLIKNNIEYGLESNNSFISFSSEKSYFLLERYGYLSKSNPSFGSLNDTLVLGIHQKTFKHGKPNLQNTFGSKYQKIGSTYLSYNQSLNAWVLTIDPY